MVINIFSLEAKSPKALASQSEKDAERISGNRVLRRKGGWGFSAFCFFVFEKIFYVK